MLAAWLPSQAASQPAASPGKLSKDLGTSHCYKQQIKRVPIAGMGKPRTQGYDAFDVLLAATMLLHLLAAPYTKVEESFNIQVR